MTASVVARRCTLKLIGPKRFDPKSLGPESWVQQLVSKTLSPRGPRLAADNLNRRGRSDGNAATGSEIVVCKMILVRHDRITG